MVGAACGPRALGHLVVVFAVAANEVVCSHCSSAVAGVGHPLPEANTALSFWQILTLHSVILREVITICALGVGRDCGRHCVSDLRADRKGTELDAYLQLHHQGVLLDLR